VTSAALASKWVQGGQVALGVGLGVVYSLIAHMATVHSSPGFWQVLSALFLVLVLAFSLAWRSPRRPWILTLYAAGVAGLLAMGGWLQSHYQWLFFLEHVSMQTLLCLVFGRTLAAGQTPLVSHFAAAVHGVLSPHLQRYTRSVTWAWTLYFGAMASISVLLFSFAPIAWWSTFANLLGMPLLALMFVGDYVVRRCVLPPEDVASLWQAVQSCRQVGMPPLR